MTISDPHSSITRHPSSPAVIEFGPFRYDRLNRILSRDGVELTIPPRVLGVLDFLLERKGKVVSKEALIEGVWNGSFVTETSLTEAISQLRQALGDDPQNPTYIQTVHRRGYRFIAPVEIVSEGPLGTATSADAGLTTPDGARRNLLLWLVLLSVVLAAGFFLGRLSSQSTSLPESQPTEPAYLAIAIPQGQSILPWISNLAISPDGELVVYVAEIDDERMLVMRAIRKREGTIIRGSEGAGSPFFSPDGRWLGFVASGVLKKSPVSGGGPITLVENPRVAMASWGDDGRIIFSTIMPGGLMRVSAEGGPIERISWPDAMRGEVAHLHATVLPGARQVVFTAWSSTIYDARLDVLSLETGERRPLVDAAASAKYSATGHLVFSKPGSVVAVPFDAKAAKITGAEVAVLDDVSGNPVRGLDQFAVSSHGALVYFGNENLPVDRELVELGRNGVVSSRGFPPKLYRNLEVGRSGERFAATVLEDSRSDVWVGDLKNGSIRRLTFEGFNIEPVWSPDGAFVAFSSNRSGPYNVWRRAVSGETPAERILESDQHQHPVAWSPDGTTMIIGQRSPETGFDLYFLDLETLVIRPFIVARADQFDAAFSPDGHWIAWDSNETGEWRVYVTNYPDARGRWEIPGAPGFQPSWSPRGDRLYYLNEGLWEVDVTPGSAPTFGEPRLISDLETMVLPQVLDQETFLMIREQEGAEAPTTIQVILDWLR